MTGLPESQSAFNSLGDFVPTGRKAKNLPVEQTGKELVSSNSRKGITLFHNTQRPLSHFEMEKLRETANSVRRMLPVTSKKRLTLWTFSVQFRMSLWPLINAHCDDRMAQLITLKSKRFKASRRIDGLLSAELKKFPTSALQHVFSACTQNPAGVLSNHVIRRLFYTWDTKKTDAIPCIYRQVTSRHQRMPSCSSESLAKVKCFIPDSHSSSFHVADYLCHITLKKKWRKALENILAQLSLHLLTTWMCAKTDRLAKSLEAFPFDGRQPWKHTAICPSRCPGWKAHNYECIVIMLRSGS